MKKKHIIIGVAAAGIGAAQKLRQLDPNASIICISDENEIPYNKCNLADYVSGLKTENQMYTLTKEQAANKNIELMLGKKVIALNPHQKNIELNDGQKIEYDTLLLAVGTCPAMPNLPKINELKGIFNFHRLRDAQGILDFIVEHKIKKAIVVGAGLSGLECADSLAHLKIDVSVIEQQSRVLASYIDETGSHFIEQCMRYEKISFYSNQNVIELLEHNGFVHGIKLENGTELEADMVIFAIGLKPNLSLSHNTSIMSTHEGIITDDYMQTNVPGIYAAGDIALVKDQLTGQLVPNRTWPDAMLQGLIAAHSMAGQPKKYPGLLSIISSAFFGVKFARCGILTNLPDSFEVIIKNEKTFYHKYVLEDGYLKGFLLIGETEKLGILRRLLLTHTKISIDQL
jgi:NAD(P)H-nitrite reductase large subunit